MPSRTIKEIIWEAMEAKEDEGALPPFWLYVYPISKVP